MACFDCTLGQENKLAFACVGAQIRSEIFCNFARIMRYRGRRYSFHELAPLKTTETTSDRWTLTGPSIGLEKLGQVVKSHFKICRKRETPILPHATHGTKPASRSTSVKSLLCFRGHESASAFSVRKLDGLETRHVDDI